MRSEKKGYWISSRYLDQASILNPPPSPVCLHTSVTCSDLPSNISSMTPNPEGGGCNLSPGLSTSHPGAVCTCVYCKENKLYGEFVVLVRQYSGPASLGIQYNYPSVCTCVYWKENKLYGEYRVLVCLFTCVYCKKNILYGDYVVLVRQYSGPASLGIQYNYPSVCTCVYCKEYRLLGE